MTRSVRAPKAPGSNPADGLTPMQRIASALSRRVGRLKFAPPVAHVYNPLDYAWEAHAAYLARYGAGLREILLLGMNPGPFGMAQTGVPFGDVARVRDWLGIRAGVTPPARQHPRRPVEGFDCKRSEVSGARFWGWASERFGSPDRFFERFFVLNYCPLALMEESGRNLTPDKLRAGESAALFEACDESLRDFVDLLRPRLILGVGAFAESRIRAALPDYAGAIGRILHPSPASPAANRDWAGQVDAQLRAQGVRL